MRFGVMAVVVLALGALPAAAKGPAAPQAPAMKQVMADHVNPGALAFWAGGNDPPDNETPAAAKIRWAEAVKGAQAMQQWGRTMQAAPYIRSGHWKDYAQLMIEQAALGEAASKAKDAPKAFDIGGRLYDACNGCHKTYVPRVDLPM